VSGADAPASWPVEPPPAAAVEAAITAALAEDLGGVGDLTTSATIPPGRVASGRLVARASGTIAGLSIAAGVFDHLDGEVVMVPGAGGTGSGGSGSGGSGSGGSGSGGCWVDGDRVAAGTVLATLEGDARAMLTGERTALNLLGHLSGIATATRTLVDVVAGTDARIVDTRKTTPGLRALERYAVRCGGGRNHRYGLHDAVMIKDNHLVAAGSITAAVRAVRARVGHMVRVVLEVDGLDQLPEALEAGVDVVLLDNFGPDALREAVALIDGAAVTEASGGITLDTVRAVAETGVDVISVGWITHSAPRLDVALDLEVR